MKKPDIDPDILIKDIEYDMCAAVPKLCLDCPQSYYLEDIRDLIRYYRDQELSGSHKCFLCGGECYWQNDFNAYDLGYDEEGLVSYWMCSKCGAMYEIRSFEKEGEDNGLAD